MSRQGEGYGFPDNSKEAILAALEDGYRNIRISIASTKDEIIYCTHSYEMKNNDTFHVLEEGNRAIDRKLFINNETSETIDQIQYRKYPIPRLETLLKDIACYDCDITLELKDKYTEKALMKIIDLTRYYNTINFTLSSDPDTIMQLSKIDESLNLAVIFQYTDGRAKHFINLFENKTKELRFDCYYSDEITKESIITVVHPKYRIKLGGQPITQQNLKDYAGWIDVIEYSLKISQFPPY